MFCSVNSCFWLLFCFCMHVFLLFFLCVCHRCDWLPATTTTTTTTNITAQILLLPSRCHWSSSSLRPSERAVVTSFYVTVKYLREVTPYFRKASIISEVGWELQRGFLSGAPPSPHSPQRADTRYLPLQLCYLVRNYRHPDPGTFWK